MKLFRKTECWVPTWTGGFLLVSLIAAIAILMSFGLYSFLSRQVDRPDASLVILEGWMNDAELSDALSRISPDQMIITSGGPIIFGRGLLPYDTYAEITAARLALLGIPTNRIIAAPAPEVVRNRTYESACAIRGKLQARGLWGQSAVLYSVGPHARRSHLLFREAFGKNYPIGVESIDPSEYPRDKWFVYSAGVRQVFSELLAWLYAKGFVLFNG